MYKYIRQTKDENITTFVNRLSDTEWNDVYDCNDVNNAYTLFLEKYIDEYNSSCPIVKVKNKVKHDKSWLTKGLIKAIKKINNLYK